MHKPGARSLRIISGGQTGVDRAALDIAFELGLEHGGWCPQGRRAEDGSIPAQYHLRETAEHEYSVRTKLNVMDADGTLLLYRGQLEGGSQLTAQLASSMRKPLLAVDLDSAITESTFRDWLRQHEIKSLNVAGPRESKQPGIYRHAVDVLRKLLA